MSLPESILATIQYSAHFNFPLTLQELHSRLISYRVSQLRLIRQLRLMLKQKLIAQTRDYYHLPRQSRLVAARLTHENLSEHKLGLARTAVAKLAGIPGVLAIYLTGSLAVRNAGQDDDIDLMVIAESGRLWSTRLLLTLYCELLGVRRRPNSLATNNRLCLNLYLTPDSYKLPAGKRNLYTAYELIQVVPLYDPHGTRSALLAANPWLTSYLPNFSGTDPCLPRSDLKRNSRVELEKGSRLRRERSDLIGKFLDFFESLAYHLQLLYMQRHLTREYITRDSAFFHPSDPGRDIMQKLKVRSCR